MLSSSTSSLPRKKKSSVKRERKQVVQQVAASDADDEGSLDQARPSRACGTSSNSNHNNNRTTNGFAKSQSTTVPQLICSVLSMTYSDDEDGTDGELVPLPPPVAPTYLESPKESHSSRYNTLLSPAASLQSTLHPVPHFFFQPSSRAKPAARKPLKSWGTPRLSGFLKCL